MARYVDVGGGAVRWVFIGDSMVFSGQARTGLSFPDITVRRVTERYPRVEMTAFNLGVPAHTSFQTLRVLKKEFPRTRPHIVVYWGASNDNSPASGYSDRGFALLYGGPMYTVRRVLDRSAFIRWTRTLRGPEQAPTVERPPKDSFTYPRRVDPGQYERNVLAMARFTSHRGAEFLALTRQHARFDTPLDQYNARLENLAARRELVLLDIRDLYPTAVEEGIVQAYPQDKVHFNEKGYRLVAERTAHRIIEEGWIDSLCTRSFREH